MASGPLTIDGVPLQQLYMDTITDIGVNTERTQDLIGMFAGAPTIKSTVAIRMRGMEAKRRGMEGGNAAVQHMPTNMISLDEPVAFEWAAGITRDAWERGMTSDEVMAQSAELTATDRRLVTQAILNAMFRDGAWYDGSCPWAPPPFEGNTFAVTHNHYLTYAASGLPTQTIMADCKRHLAEHGVFGNVTAWVHGSSITAIEKLGELADNATMNTPFIQALQTQGFTAGFTMNGVPVIGSDWVPEGYMLVFAMPEGRKPLRWRRTENPATGSLMLIPGPGPTESMQWHEAAHRWISATVVEPAFGCAVWLSAASDSDAYVDPAILDLNAA